MGSLVHTGLGSSSLVAHVIHSPLPPREQLYQRYCSNKHTHISYIGSNTPTHTLTIRAFLFSAILSTSTATGVQRIGLVPFQARGSLRVVEEQSRTRGGESGGVTDQPLCRGLWHSSSPSARSFTRSPSSPPPFTQFPFPPRSLVRDGQTSPHRPQLVVSRSTCPPISPSPHEHSFVTGTAVINNL
jgi:hypothetical protein